MAKPISIQLYTVREQMAEDLWGTLGKIAAIGYPGIEPCGPLGDDLNVAAKRIRNLGLTVSAYQAGTPAGDNKNRLLDEAETLATDHIVCPMCNADEFKTLDGIKKIAETFAEAIDNCAERGMTFGYHNHDWELQTVIDGKPALLHLAGLLPNLCFTVDTYWVTVGGQDAVAILGQLGLQASLLHMKDGPLNRAEAMTAVGSGKMNFPPIVKAAPAADWLVVELDRCDTDMMAAVEESYQYLVTSGLARGK